MARRHEPVRTCLACRQEGLKPELVRLVAGPQGLVVVDRTGHAPGRGAYLHPDKACVEAARKRRLVERSLGATVPDSVWSELHLPAVRGGREGRVRLA